MRLFGSSRATQYIFFEMIPAFVMGLFVFIFIILMFQALRYTEFVLIHGVGLSSIGKIISFVTISILPAILPMSLLFSVLLTYGRLSSDSEIIALKSSGLSLFDIVFPSVLVSALVAMLSMHTSFTLGPWGNRQFELLITELGQTKAGATIREGTFSEGFFDMVIYADRVSSKEGQLEKVFIYDEKSGDVPLTIIAKSGQLVQDPDKPGHKAQLRLINGAVHRKAEAHTKIKFDTFDIKLFDPIVEEQKQKTPPSLQMTEIEAALKDPNIPLDRKNLLTLEFHKRWAITIVCLVFGLLGAGLGITTNRRQQKTNGMIISIMVVVGYWILFISLEGAAKSQSISPILAAWTPNGLFLLLATWALKKNAD